MSIQPVSKDNRISLIDVLRGYAVFAIFFVNILYFSSPDLFYQLAGVLPEESPVNRGVRFAVEMFLSGKSYPILSFLFGLGFYLLMRRTEQKGRPMFGFFFRRMLVLFVFGMVHMVFFYNGDALHTYAWIGCLLMLFYRRTEKTIRLWTISVFVVFFLMFALAFLAPADSLNAGGTEKYAAAEQTAAAAIQAYREGSYGEWLAFRFEHEVLPSLMMEGITYPSTFGLMLLGFYFGRIGVFENAQNHLPFFRKMRNVCAAVSLPTAVLFVLTRLELLGIGAYHNVLGQFLVYGWGLFLSFLYVSLLVLLFQKPIGQKLLHPLQFAGRMTLTNYILQSVLSTAIFAGLGVYAKLDFLTVIGLCIAIIAIEIGFSRWWMNRFPFGPMEWVWRLLTYGRLGKVPPIAAKAAEPGTNG
jgi:uncharacterized protein